MSGQLSYVYAVVRAPAAAPDEIRGVYGAPVTLVRSGAVAAAVSAVPGEEFSETALGKRLEDLDWLETTARAHHFVVDALAARDTVLPLRLATVYRDDARVAEMLSQRQELFGALLDRLEGHVEWGVKVYAEAGAGLTAPSATRDEPDSGRAYLRRRRQQYRSREEVWRAAETAVRRTEEEARALAVDRARHRPQQGELAEGPGDNVANDAYLVPRGLGEEFRERMEHAADDLPGVRVEVTGPWAPYSFAVLPEGSGPP
ncbi:GvpL/GvpF family gas vesicle protein [Streptomyces sp. P17]|uniref:GvpL/GvpF family gas vesicle protein n=1 Tax=Streptomyces sp. P17 TaxID=3074716 RepID=UPI0028F41127|nr:GvpL/GvpF family gas vesicle protein [Streptomyces sp. P17]MDT9701600.1 GvpL/GvpF family gas vesicle protein [Streptomyces sp. P17]